MINAGSSKFRSRFFIMPAKPWPRLVKFRFGKLLHLTHTRIVLAEDAYPFLCGLLRELFLQDFLHLRPFLLIHLVLQQILRSLFWELHSCYHLCIELSFNIADGDIMVQCSVDPIERSCTIEDVLASRCLRHSC